MGISRAPSDLLLEIHRLAHDPTGVSPEDVIMLVISWHLNAATMCEFSKEEFETGEFLVVLNQGPPPQL